MAGTQIMVCGSGLPFLSRDKLTHTRALGKQFKMDRQASLVSSCCLLAGARRAAQLSPTLGPHQADSCFSDFLLLHEVETLLRIFCSRRKYAIRRMGIARANLIFLYSVAKDQTCNF